MKHLKLFESSGGGDYARPISAILPRSGMNRIFEMKYIKLFENFDGEYAKMNKELDEIAIYFENK